MAKVFRAFIEKLSGDVTSFIGEEGDLFFDPDTQVLRIGDGSAGGNLVTSSGGVQSEIVDGDEKVKCSNDTIAFETEGTPKWVIDNNGNIIPTTDNAHDIGSAEFKVRDMYVSENSLWVGDNHKVDVEGGKMKFRKRKKDHVPKSITDVGGNSDDAKTSSGKSELSDITLHEWKVYANTLSGLETATIKDLWPSNSIANKGDYDEITEPGAQQGHKIIFPIISSAMADIDLMISNTAIMKHPTSIFGVNINGANSAEGATFEVTIHVIQGGSAYGVNTDAITVDGAALIAAAQVTVGNTANHVIGKLSTYKIYGVHIDNWKVTVLGYPEA